MSMLMEYFFNLKQAKLIIYSVIFTDLNYPVRWYIFILWSLVHLSCKYDHGR